jgi:glycosyltransferase involved in cell wall biosynthesis
MTSQTSQQKSRPKVLIVERQLLQYRLAFYEKLRHLLDKEGIDLQLLFGNGTAAEAEKKNQVSLDWAMHIPTHYLFGTSVCWQPFGSHAKNADLVIVMHENKILYNLWLMSFGRPKRLAFWGHGRNMQSDNPNGLKERFKRWTINRVDWWFAYTKTSASLVADAGFPTQRTTIVENAVDTQKLTQLCQQVTANDLKTKKEQLQIGDGPVALYLGSLYKEKRLDFLLEAAVKIRQRTPDFQLLIAGAGPELALIEIAERNYPWVHYLGPLQEEGKAIALVLADVILNPGLVGLGILDSFASGTPMFTTDCDLHSPEISYLSPGYNGVMTNNDIDVYVDTVVEALRYPDILQNLRNGALSSAPQYTIGNMVNRIQKGISLCLASV